MARVVELWKLRSIVPGIRWAGLCALALLWLAIALGDGRVLIGLPLLAAALGSVVYLRRRAGVEVGDGLDDDWF